MAGSSWRTAPAAALRGFTKVFWFFAPRAIFSRCCSFRRSKSSRRMYTSPCRRPAAWANRACAGPGTSPPAPAARGTAGRGVHLVEQRVDLHADDEQQHQGGVDVDEALPFPVGRGPDQVHGDVAAAVARG